MNKFVNCKECVYNISMTSNKVICNVMIGEKPIEFDYNENKELFILLKDKV